MAIILVVDDDPTIRTIAAELLRGEDHTVIEAGDGDEALQVLRSTRVDLVVLDMLMPNRDGLETIMDIRQNYPGVRILAISSGGSLGVRDLLGMARVFGADETLAKPLSFSTFGTTVRRLLENPDVQPSPFAVAKA